MENHSSLHILLSHALITNSSAAAFKPWYQVSGKTHYCCWDVAALHDSVYCPSTSPTHYVHPSIMYLSTTTKQRQYLLNIHPTTTGRYCSCSCPCKRLTLYTHRHTRTSHKIVTNKCQHFLETPCQPLQPRLLEEDTHTHTHKTIRAYINPPWHTHTHTSVHVIAV